MFIYRQHDVQQYLNAVLDLAVWAYMCRLLGGCLCLLCLLVIILIMSLSDIQQAILSLITNHINADGVSPSQTEIARAFGFKGVRAVQHHLDVLEQQGMIRRVPGQARGIRLKHLTQVDEAALALQSEDVLRLPVLGRVAAGQPIGADIGEDRVVLLDRVFFSPAPDYLLRVQGDSMRDEGIFDGDLIGVHHA